MLGLGWTEMLVIGVVALIFIGPKDLPVVMGRVGKVIGQIQRMGREFQREINKTTGLDEVRNLRTSITSPLKQTADEIRKEFNSIGKDGKESPSGALKPTNPAEESVVEAIQQQAGMAPAKKSNDEMAADYGFTAKKAEPVKAARASKGATASAKSATAKSVPAKAAAPKPAARKPKAQADNAAPAGETAKPAKPRAARAAASKATAGKSAVKATKKAPASKPETASAAAKPAKPRAPRKKAAETAGKTE
ncbi:Sec-independent protein translocase protein TatB [Devosia sp. XK-2]|uniref:Sec-independent protein translocase protein TatB n=1 Tax=Devosia sp. XK-2 TaxID=3126689 RepID=UPI0030CBB743